MRLFNFIKSFLRFFGFKSLKTKQYVLREFSNRSTAVAAAKERGFAALQQSDSVSKWIIFTCPCGCGEQVALNLMLSHYPYWRVQINSPKDFSISPSVDSTTCKSHYWIKNGKVVWC